MCQKMYSYLKHNGSATNRLLINPIELNSKHEFGTELNQQGKIKYWQNVTLLEMLTIIVTITSENESTSIHYSIFTDGYKLLKWPLNCFINAKYG